MLLCLYSSHRSFCGSGIFVWLLLQSPPFSLHALIGLTSITYCVHSCENFFMNPFLAAEVSLEDRVVLGFTMATTRTSFSLWLKFRKRFLAMSPHHCISSNANKSSKCSWKANSETNIEYDRRLCRYPLPLCLVIQMIQIVTWNPQISPLIARHLNQRHRELLLPLNDLIHSSNRRFSLTKTLVRPLSLQEKQRLTIPVVTVHGCGPS